MLLVEALAVEVEELSGGGEASVGGGECLCEGDGCSGFGRVVVFDDYAADALREFADVAGPGVVRAEAFFYDVGDHFDEFE